ncbi:septal ring lytic transglycosylase RlpA family protein [Methylopila henanensis]|uniref:Endolytic peptidoglycan transglycosylase RlpA n=1 Tax=Methylopila henanensis TaxID=873516 RepID=A0ABW4K3A5_9HYPH
MTDAATTEPIQRRRAFRPFPSRSDIAFSRFALGRVAAASVAALACGLIAGCSAQTGRPVAAATSAPAASVAAAEAPQQDAVKTAAAQPAQVRAAGGRAVAASASRRTNAVGLASWYGSRFHGRRTANGETYDMRALTAAHPSLPLPSYVRVTNVSNGRSLVVRVNDRGPFHRGRIIDVSSRAADVLGFKTSGVGNVKVDYVGPASTSGSEDLKLLATYQEFGRPAAPEGVQMASLKPVRDADLVNGAGAAPTVVAAAQPVRVQTNAPAAAAAATPVRPEPPQAPVVAYAAQPAAKPSALGAPLAQAARVAAAPAEAPAPKAQAPRVQTPPQIALKPSMPPAPAKRVVQPAEPVLASVAPAIGAEEEPAAPAAVEPERRRAGGSEVSARIAASFEGFDSFAKPQDGGAAFSSLR